MSGPSPTPTELRRRVDDRLIEVLEERRSSLPDAGPLIGAIGEVIGAGGKRLRPAFCYWGYRAAGGVDRAEILDVAASLELLHTFAIVHDDIMDAAPERRGIPSVHAVHGVDFALLVGDLALVLADDLFMRSGFAADVVARGFGCYSRMRQEVIAGQFLDLQAATAGEIDEEQARRIAVLKSGRYSVEEPLFIGAVLEGASNELLEQLRRFAAPLGEAFQLRDDLLGTFGTTATGKPVDSDIRQGKRNILFAKTLAALTGSERTYFLERWGGGDAMSDGEVERLKDTVEATGARGATESLLERLRDEVEAALEAIEVDGSVKAALEELRRMTVERDS